MKKIYYGIVMGFQGYMILISVINLIFCVITGNSNQIFFGSIYLFFVPYIRYINSGNIFEILILVLFFVFTIAVYILSLRELFNDKNLKAPFTIINVIWMLLSYASVILAVDSGISYNFIPYITLILLLIVLILIKWSEQNKAMRSKTIPDEEDPLAENFQLSAKSYRQIARTAKGSPIIETGVFLVSIYLKYLYLQSFTFVTWFYLITVVLAILIFIGTIYDCRSFKKKTGQCPPSENFLKKLNIMQIVSFILFAISFAIVR